jgi:pimeloyl-ACP methyl ester carboxylesterase
MIFKNPVIKKVVKFFLVAYVAITLLVIAVFVWIYFSYLSGPGAFSVNEYHPFRSEIAKEEYLAYYDALSEEWPIDSENRMVSTSYGQTFVRISGPEDAPPIVLLPGGGTSSLMWKDNIEALSENFRTYAVDDIYDWGRSVYTKRMGCPECIPLWLDELFTALDLKDSINLVGASYGAWKSSQYLLSHPERINKVVWLCPAYTVYHGNPEFEKRVFRGFIPLRHFMKKELYWSCEDMAQTEGGREFLDDHLDGLRLAIRSFKTKIPASMTVLSDDELKSIHLPVLYLAGENEKMYSVKDAVHRLENISPNIACEVIPNTGHCLMFSRPGLVNNKILDFLKQ